uniref:thioredoxin-dependent peroxiredoxin n=1 Tax=Megaselia scalaris TaxID=36166 RepID=T1GNY4_MEGSC
MKIARDYGILDEESDGKQNFRQVTVNDLPVGRNVHETLRLVQAFQFIDEHREVCPANWKPDAKSMIADPKKSKDYFAAVN